MLALPVINGVPFSDYAKNQKLQIKKYIPADILKPFIKTFLIIESENETVNRLLPDTSVVMAFRLKGETYTGDGIKNALPVSAISGLPKSARLLGYSKDAATLLIIFNEAGATAFFDEPLHELSGISISLDHFMTREKVNEIENRLAEAIHDAQRISIIENFLSANLAKTQTDPLIHDALQRIKSTNGNVKIKELANSLNISQDPFEKRFRKLIGASPKQFSTIIRLRNLIKTYSPTQSLTHAAYEAGYFDQSHFIKDFKSFTGQKPHDFFKSPAYW